MLAETRMVGGREEYRGSDGEWYPVHRAPVGGFVRPGNALSPDQRRTQRNRAILDSGRHPATHRLLDTNGLSCGECAHCVVKDSRTSTSGTRRWYGCTLHRLGLSSSAASDIRVSWPACDLFEERSEA